MLKFMLKLFLCWFSVFLVIAAIVYGCNKGLSLRLEELSLETQIRRALNADYLTP